MASGAAIAAAGLAVRSEEAPRGQLAEGKRAPACDSSGVSPTSALRLAYPLAAALALAACGSPPVAAPDGGGVQLDAGPLDGGAFDAGLADAGALDGGGVDGGGVDGGPADAGPADAGPLDGGRDAGQALFDAGPAPVGELHPELGELTLIQLDLPPGVLLRTGEAAIVVGPDGTLALIDVGAASHADELVDAVRELNTRWLTPARGYRARTPLEVEWVVLTHFHGDHIGAFERLSSGTDALRITRGVVHRGFVDVGAGLNAGDYQALCTALRGPLAALDRPLCASSSPAPCDPATFRGSSPASGCTGLFKGDLSDPGDDGQGAPTFLPLGGGARLTLLGADGFASDGVQAVAAPAFGVDENNEENARSVAGLVSHGAFCFLFAGDLSGSGQAGEPDLESHLVAQAAPLLGPLGVDVVHANHHARRTSSNARFVSATAPADGRIRHVVAGINAAYANSPHPEVLAAWEQGGRLAQGAFVATRKAPAGSSSPRFIEAGGNVVVRTLQGGRGYRLQAPATGLLLTARSVRDP